MPGGDEGHLRSVAPGHESNSVQKCVRDLVPKSSGMVPSGMSGPIGSLTAGEAVLGFGEAV